VGLDDGSEVDISQVLQCVLKRHLKDVRFSTDLLSLLGAGFKVVVHGLTVKFFAPYVLL